jgi:hypothetical protein
MHWRHTHDISQQLLYCGCGYRLTSLFRSLSLGPKDVEERLLRKVNRADALHLLLGLCISCQSRNVRTTRRDSRTRTFLVLQMLELSFIMAAVQAGRHVGPKG